MLQPLWRAVCTFVDSWFGLGGNPVDIFMSHCLLLLVLILVQNTSLDSILLRSCWFHSNSTPNQTTGMCFRWWMAAWCLTGSRGWVSLTSKLTFTVYGRDASMGAWALCRELPATQYCWQALTVTCNTPFQTKNLQKAWFLHSLHLLDFWFWKSRDAGAMLDFIWCWQCCICVYLSRCTSTGLIPNLGHPLLLWRQLGM